MADEENKKKKKKKSDSEDLNMSPSSDIPQSKSFKKLEDILQMETAKSSGGAFDESLQEAERKKMEERKQKCEEFKKQLEEWKNKPLDDYTVEVVKVLIEKGMRMIDALEKEILDSPRGRDVETAAAMMNSISGIVDMLNKKKVSNSKLDLEKEKFEFKKQTVNIDGPPQYNQTNIIVGSHKDLLDMIRGDKPLPFEEKEAEIIKEDETKE